MTKPLYQPADHHREAAANAKANDGRSEFRRDLARLIHSPCLRRLQGKTQLFPSDENDFFRNRLTHSLEVAQIATGIAINLNADKLAADPVDESVVHLAALAHDIGHPPFGHNGEKALDEKMKEYGGFEGNAQTLRILSRLEKKETTEYPRSSNVARPINNGADLRLGLNLTYRSMAAVLKYDVSTPETKDECIRKGLIKRPVKGFYKVDKPIVDKIKAAVAPKFDGYFKTIECSIMDLADDIAYSTYDLEDALKAQFLTPLSMAAAPASFKGEIAAEINEKIVEIYGSDAEKLDVKAVDAALRVVFAPMLDDIDTRSAFVTVTEIQRQSSILADVGYYRTDFTSKLVYQFMQGIEYNRNDEFPPMSSVRFDLETFKVVEILKKYAYKSLIMSPRFKMAESQGKEIINEIFERLIKDEDGRRLLPGDWSVIYHGGEGAAWANRTICDFISSMTDRYCLEFYSRLKGINAPSFYKPY